MPVPAALHLVRHGRSAHVHAGWIDGAGFTAWRAAYEAAGIVADERPPEPLVRLAAEAGAIVASDAPRAVESARLLAAGREIVATPLLRELDLLAPPLGPLRMPLPFWALAVGLRNVANTAIGRFRSEGERRRVGDATAWLVALAASHGSVLALTHASVRRRIAVRLVAAGWTATGDDRSLRHWSAWSFARELPSS